MKKTFAILMTLLLVACCAIALAAGPSATTDNITGGGAVADEIGAAVVNVEISPETQAVIDDVAAFLEEGKGQILDYIAAHYGQDIADECAEAFGKTFEEADPVVFVKEIMTVAKVGDLSAPVSDEKLTTIAPNKLDEKVTGVASHDTVGRHVELHIVDEYHIGGYIDEAVQDYVSAGKKFTLFILGVSEE